METIGGGRAGKLKEKIWIERGKRIGPREQETENSRGNELDRTKKTKIVGLDILSDPYV